MGAGQPLGAPLALSLAGIELGYEHTCGLDSSGRAYCMGDNQYGQLGSSLPMRRCQSGQHPCSQTPLAVDGGITFVQLGLDQRHSCARSTDGSIYCWGFGEGGQLGDGLRASSRMPVRVQVAVRLLFLEWLEAQFRWPLNWPKQRKRQTRRICVTRCGRLCPGSRMINLSVAVAEQLVGIREVDDQVWQASFCFA